MQSSQPFFRMRIFLLSLLAFIGICNALDCTNSRQEWVRLRYTSLLGSAPPVINAGLIKDICPATGSSSCCDQTTEREMYALGHRQLLHQANWLQIAEQMNNDSNALEYFFRSDLEQAKNRLHQFFSRIYGYNYKLHRSFFFQFFTDLEEYMAGRRGQLANLVDNFFSQLRDSIVSLIERSTNPMLNNPSSGSFGMGGNTNSATSAHGTGQVVTDEASEARRIKCLSERVAQLRPFDEVDVRLKARILEAYPPARMLVNVMSTTSRLLSHLAFQISERPECVLGLTRFRFCVLCAGQPLASVCPASCQQLMSSCLHVTGSDSTQLTAVWPRLIEAIVMATTRLERSFNFPAVNRNLQMEISEAITSLQARYEQTKSKFEAECRMASTSRSVPTLFSSGGAGMNPNMNNPQLQSMGMNQAASFPGWPPISSRYNRWRRAVNATRSRMRRARSPQMASPEFLNWQTRPRGPPMRSTHNGYNIPSENMHAGNVYGPPEPNTAWSTSGAMEGAADVPERLMRWAGQLKRAYTTLSNAFSVPGANFCPPVSADSNITHFGSSQSNCWNPPQLNGPLPHHGISETMRHLNEAAERLHQASASNSDPDALIIQLPPPMHPLMGAVPSQVTFNSPYAGQQQQQLVQPLNGPMEQWHSPDQPVPPGAFQGSMPSGQQEMFIGSGDGSIPDSPISPLRNEGSQDLYGFPSSSRTPPNYDQQPSISQPSSPDPSSVDSPSSGHSSFYESEAFESTRSVTSTEAKSKESEDLRTSDAEMTSFPSTPTTTVVPTNTSRVLESTVTTTNTTTIATTTSEPTTQLSTTASVEVATTSTPPTDHPKTLPPPVVVPPGNSWRTSEHKQIVQTEQLSPFEHRRPEFGSQPGYEAPLPDDEDTLPQLSEVAQPQALPSPSPLYNPSQQTWNGMVGAPAQLPDKPLWWENPQSGGSGFGQAGYYHSQPYQPVGVNPPGQPFDWLPGHPNTPSPYGSMEGSGMRLPYPSEPSVQTPEAMKPNEGYHYQAPQPNLPFGQQSPPEWSQPQNPQYFNNFGGQSSGSWAEPNTGTYPDAITPWQDNTRGSGTGEAMDRLPEHIDPSTRNQHTKDLPQPPAILPLPRKPETAAQHPPVPPPEVWVPAQLGPGQPMSSVLLVREYNVQGPFYGPETVHTKQSSAVTTFTAHLLPIIATILCMLQSS